jgi:hypothetical protein
MSSNTVGHLLVGPPLHCNTSPHFATLHHTLPNYTSLHLSTLHLLSFTLHYPLIWLNPLTFPIVLFHLTWAILRTVLWRWNCSLRRKQKECCTIPIFGIFICSCPFECQHRKYILYIESSSAVNTGSNLYRFLSPHLKFNKTATLLFFMHLL